MRFWKGFWGNENFLLGNLPSNLLLDKFFAIFKEIFKMKKMFLLFAILISTYNFACSCSNWGKPFDAYSSSELVADVTFTKVYPDLENKKSKYINVDLKYNEIFKGKVVKTIQVYGAIFEGNKIYGSFTSCSLGAKVGQRMIIFMNKNEKGNLTLHYCDPKINYGKENRTQIVFEKSKDILRLIKAKNLITNTKHFYANFGFSDETQKDDFESVKGLTVKNKFAVFEIILNSDGTFKNVMQLQAFESDKDEEIFQIIKKAKIMITPNYNFTEDEKFTLIMFFYPKEKNNLSFVSQIFL